MMGRKATSGGGSRSAGDGRWTWGPRGHAGRVRPILLLGLSWWSLLGAVEVQAPWIPAEHPASITRDLTGYTRPRRMVVLSAEISGRIESITGEVGDVLQTGPAVVLHDVLARHDLSASQANLTVAQTVRRKAELDDGFRRQELTRIEKLAAKGRVSAEERDAAVHAAEQAGLALAAADAEVVRARAGAARSQEMLDRHHIEAPAGMTVIRRHVEPGTVVSSGQPLLTIADCRTLTIELKLSHDELAMARSRKDLTVEFPQFGGRPVPVRLARVDPDVDPATRRRRVELDLDGTAAPEPSGGLETVLRLSLPDPSGGVLVPQDRVRKAFDHQVVTLIDGRILPITPLRVENGFVVVAASALPPGTALP